MHGLGVILVLTGRIHVDPAEAVLCRGQSLIGCPGIQLDGLVLALGNAPALIIQVAKVVLGCGESLLSGLAKPFGSFTEVAAYAVTHGQGLAVGVLSAHVSLLGGSFVKLGRARAAGLGALAFGRQASQHVAGLAVFLFGEGREKLDGFFEVVFIESFLDILKNFTVFGGSGRCGRPGRSLIGRLLRGVFSGRGEGKPHTKSEGYDHGGRSQFFSEEGLGEKHNASLKQSS